MNMKQQTRSKRRVVKFMGVRFQDIIQQASGQLESGKYYDGTAMAPAVRKHMTGIKNGMDRMGMLSLDYYVIHWTDGAIIVIKK